MNTAPIHILTRVRELRTDLQQTQEDLSYAEYEYAAAASARDRAHRAGDLEARAMAANEVGRTTSEIFRLRRKISRYELELMGLGAQP